MNLKQKLRIGFLTGGLVALTACDNAGEIELAKETYEGPVEISLIQEVDRGDKDDYVLVVKDSTGTILARMESINREPDAQLKVDGKTYDLEYRGYRVAK